MWEPTSFSKSARRNRSRGLVPVLAVLLSLGAASEVSAFIQVEDLPYGRAEQDCVRGLNGAAEKVSLAVRRQIRTCMGRKIRGLLAESAEACMLGDERGKIATALAKLSSAADRCAGTSISTDAGAIAQAATTQEIDLIHWWLGPDVDTALVPYEEDKNGGKCQLDVVKQAQRCHRSKLREYNRCKVAGLATFDELADFEACYDADPKGRVQRDCGEKLDVKIAKRCDAKQIDVAKAFRGVEPEPTLTSAVASQSSCAMCLVWNDVDGLGRDCDLFDDGAANASCSANLVLRSGLTQMALEQGESSNVAFAIEVGVRADGPHPVTFSQTVTPSAAGLSIVTDYPGGFSADDDTTFVVNNAVFGLTAGVYTITNTATVTSTGATESVDLLVTVLPAGGTLALTAPSSSPPGVEAGTQEAVVFSCVATGTAAAPATVALDEVTGTGTFLQTVATLADDGVAPDLLAGDLVYTAVMSVGPSPEGQRHFRCAGGGAESDVYDFQFSRFNVGVAPVDAADIVTGSSGMPIFTTSMIVAFDDAATEDDIEALATLVGGSVGGTHPPSKTAQIMIGASSAAEAEALAADALAHPSVSYAFPDYAASVLYNGFNPNDPFWWDKQVLTVGDSYVEPAWFISRGKGVTIAIVDDGVDYNHEDLAGLVAPGKPKVIKGKDFVEDDNDPMPCSKHGTAAAGVAAAIGNNGKGMAGVAWESQILALRTGPPGGDCNGPGAGTNHAASILPAVQMAAAMGAKIINLSFGVTCEERGALPEHDLTAEQVKAMCIQHYQDIVDAAHEAGAMVVAAAGNKNDDAPRYPAAVADLAVGAVDGKGEKANFSNFGDWVDVAAPGVQVLAPAAAAVANGRHNGYVAVNGTSFSSPFVAGVAALIWSANPGLTPAQVKERIVKTSKPVKDDPFGGGKVDVMDAVFNGGFEIGDLSGWTKAGTASSIEKLDPIVARVGKRMGFVSTGPAGAELESSLRQSITVQPGVSVLPLQFYYNFVTEEWPEFVGLGFDDTLEITLTAPNGTVTTVAVESVDTSSFQPVNGIDLPGGDLTTGQTGWEFAYVEIPVTQGAGEYKIDIIDQGDDIFDSVVLIDNIRFERYFIEIFGG